MNQLLKLGQFVKFLKFCSNWLFMYNKMNERFQEKEGDKEKTG